MDRKKFIKKSAAIGVGISMSPFIKSRQSESSATSSTTVITGNPRISKKIIVAGAGIAGLTCAYELMRKGHEVVVLDAAGRYGGKVFTSYGDMADGMYAEYGAEGFTIPGYIKYREYLDEFNLPSLPYYHNKDRYTRVNGEWLSQEEQAERRMNNVKEVGSFNSRERNYLSSNPSAPLERLYLESYLEKFNNQYRPLGIGYDHLDTVPISEIYKKEGASDAALRLLGGESSSALQKLWDCYIKKERGYWNSHQRMRIKGGNQRLVNEFGKRLESRIKLDCKVVGVEHGESSVTVTYDEFGEQKKMEANYLACCLNVQAINNVIFTPQLPPEKQFVFDNLAFDQTARVIFQARTKFWLDDKYGINLNFNHSKLGNVGQMGHEVDTKRAAIKTKSAAGTHPLDALKAFRELYPGNKSAIDIEKVLIHDWSKDPHTPGCQRLSSPFPMGELTKYWPHLQAPVGNIHFAGGYADNRTWGKEAAVNTANIVADQIDLA